MGHGYAGLIELSFTGAVAIGIGLWQYISVNREIAKDKRAREASPDSAGHPVGEHREHDG